MRCQFTDDDIETLVRAGTVLNFDCSPILDVGPGLQVWRCLAFSASPGVAWSAFEGLAQLRNWFAAREDEWDRECSRCDDAARGWCRGGCLARRIIKNGDPSVRYENIKIKEYWNLINMSKRNIKKKVREFYDQVGWQTVDEGLYQNAKYEDLRPVSAEYIHRCHMRINRHLAPEGRYFLDAGSGPVQYPEYTTYSEAYRIRVCMDISIVALKEARKRLGDHGRYVVGDVTHLPFKTNTFDGIVSLHTIHHIPMEDKLTAYDELYRTLNPGQKMVVVNGWTNALLTTQLAGFMRFMKRLRGWWLRKVKRAVEKPVDKKRTDSVPQEKRGAKSKRPAGTFVEKLNAEWLTEALKDKMEHEIYVWRSVSVAFLRAVIYPDWGGRFWLKLIYRLEECFPRLLGRIGQYPLIVIAKPSGDVEEAGFTTEV